MSTKISLSKDDELELRQAFNQAAECAAHADDVDKLPAIDRPNESAAYVLKAYEHALAAAHHSLNEEVKNDL